MGTETRIGIVTGLIIVVVASVYFFYGSSSDKDEFLVATGSKIADPAKPNQAVKIPPSPDKNKPAAPNGTKPTIANKPTGPQDNKGPAVAAKPPTPAVGQPAPTFGGQRPTTRPAVPPGMGPAVAAANRPPTSPTQTPPAGSITPPARPDQRSTVPGSVTPSPEKPAAEPPKTAVPEKPGEAVAAVPPKTTPLRTGPTKDLLDATRENVEKAEGHPTTSAPATGSDATHRTGQDSTESANRPEARPSSPSSTELRKEPLLTRKETAKETPAAETERRDSKESRTASAGTDRRPTTPTTPTAAPSFPGWPKQHKIAAGDTVAAIAQQYYGTTAKTAEILEANPQLKDPRRLKIGDTIVIPAPKDGSVTAGKTESKTPAETTEKPSTAKPAETAKATTPPAKSESSGKTYQVRDGDTFYSIAKSLYGNGNRWTDIYQLNKALLKNDPKRLKAGMVLKLPE